MKKLQRKRPLSLDHLRGFDAAARHLSFTQAAVDLHLTQSSISRQIASLEFELGLPLFKRKTRALELTLAGQTLAKLVRQQLTALDACVEELRGGEQRARVSITTIPSFASIWLIPRLAAFNRIAPEVDLRIDSTEMIIDLQAEGIDVAIRILHQDKAPRSAFLLAQEKFTPALSPLLLQGTNPIRTPADLEKATLLVMEDTLPSSQARSWERWFAAAGLRTRHRGARLMFNFIDQTLQAAARGQGVALGMSPFLDEFVSRGELVTPFEPRVSSPYGYYLLVNPDSRTLPHVKTFCEWLIGCFAKEKI